MRIGLEPFAVVDEAGEDDDAQHQEEDEQSQLLGRGFERVDEDLETGRVSRQFEQPQDADDGEELQNVGVTHVVRQLLVAISTIFLSRVEPLMMIIQSRGLSIYSIRFI